MITPYNILRHELSGLHANIKKTQHTGYKISGVVVEETKNTIKIKNKNETKTVPKDSVSFEFTLPTKTVVEVEGKLLLGRPQDRIKKKIRITY